MTALIDTHRVGPRRYTYRRCTGGTEHVVADRIEFAPGHVVFKLAGELVVAVENRNVIDLHPEPTGSETPA